MEKSYPDISPLLAAKRARRQALAALSWEEKVSIIERMRRLLPEGAWKDTPAAEAAKLKTLVRSRQDT